MVARRRDKLEELAFQYGMMTAYDVAAHAYRAMMRGQRMAIPGLRNKISVQSLRLAPRAAVLAIAAALNRSGQPAALPAR